MVGTKLSSLSYLWRTSCGKRDKNNLDASNPPFLDYNEFDLIINFYKSFDYFIGLCIIQESNGLLGG
jgi:hypothetical protein